MQGWDGCLVIISSGTTTVNATNYIASAKVISNTTSAGGGTDHEIVEAVTTEGGTTTTLTGANMLGSSTNLVAATTVTDKFIALDVRSSQLFAGDRYIGVVTVDAGTLVTHIMYIRYNGANNFKDMMWGTRTAFQFDGDT